MNGGTEMDVREKLIEILRKPIFPHELVDPTEAVADYLLDSGVTVQEWIPVTERFPKDEQDVLVIAHGWDGRLVYVGSHKRVEAQKSWLTGITNESSEWSLWGWSYLKEPMVTHWMPMPEPPETLIKED